MYRESCISFLPISCCSSRYELYYGECQERSCCGFGSIIKLLLLSGNSFYFDDGQAFSTPGRDHDKWGGGSCADLCKTGWWFFQCSLTPLTATGTTMPCKYSWDGIPGGTPLGDSYMMIRRKCTYWSLTPQVLVKWRHPKSSQTVCFHYLGINSSI